MGELVRVNGVGLYVEEYGAREHPALLYLHGGPSASCMDFCDQAEALSASLHVVAIDQRGVLRSEGLAPGAPYRLLDNLDDFEALREHLGIARWAVLGHSFGGLLACLYAHHRPDAVERVIYEAPCFSFALSNQAAALKARRWFADGGNAEGVALCERMAQSRSQGRQVWDDAMALMAALGDAKDAFYLYGITPAELGAIYARYDTTPAMYARNQLYITMLLQDDAMFQDYLPLLASNEQPALLLYGRHDPVCGEQQRAYFAQHAPKGRVVVFEHSAHFPRLEEPERYTREVERFILE